MTGAAGDVWGQLWGMRRPASPTQQQRVHGCCHQREETGPCGNHCTRCAVSYYMVKRLLHCKRHNRMASQHKYRLYCMLCRAGLHLAPRDCIARIQPTVQDLVRLAPGACILPGHCTGWRAMHELMQVVGEGSCMPCSVGGRFRFSALSPAEQALPCEQARSRCSIS
jgi:hypothetical protein